MAQAYPKIDLLLLAGGQSLRMGEENKLLMSHAGKPLVRHVAERLLASGMGNVRVVTGFDADRIETALSGLDVTFCHNFDYLTGQMSSVRVGCQSLSLLSAGTMVVLADMPLLKAEDYRFMWQRFFEEGADKILVPFFGNERGNPIVIPQSMIPEIANGSLNSGCRKLVQDHPEKVQNVTVSSSAYVWDIDTPVDYLRVTQAATMSRAPCC